MEPFNVIKNISSCFEASCIFFPIAKFSFQYTEEAFTSRIIGTAAIAPLRAQAESRGLGDFTPLWPGQNASGYKEVAAAQLTRELAADL